MKTLIIYYHPHEGSLCSSVRHAVLSGLVTTEQKYMLIDLGLDEFNPVMSSKDLYAFVQGGKNPDTWPEDVDPMVISYVEKMLWAEHIVMIFPIWWMTMPAMIKGFVDKVFFPGMVYKMEGGQLVSKLHNLLQVTIITTMNTPAAIYNEIFGNPLEGSLIKGTFNKIGIREICWIGLDMVKQATEKERRKWLDEIEHKITEYA